MAADAPPLSGSRRVDAPASGPRSRRRGLLVLVGVLIVGLVAGGVLWALARDSSSAEPIAEPWTLEPYEGLGAWVDAFDWSQALGGETPVVDEDDIVAMADLGIQTVFIQTSHLGVPDQIVLEREQLERLIDAAHDNGMSIVAWYLPTLEDVDVDLERPSRPRSSTSTGWRSTSSRPSSRTRRSATPACSSSAQRCADGSLTP